MKFFVTFFTFCSIAYSLPTKDEKVEPIPIISQESDNGFDGTFINNFETGNGIAVQQSGVVKELSNGKEVDQAQEIVGSYSYTAPDGTLVKIDYVANENGFQPHGDVLPAVPAYPPIIARALKFIEEHPPKEDKKEHAKE